MANVNKIITYECQSNGDFECINVSHCGITHIMYIVQSFHSIVGKKTQHDAEVHYTCIIPTASTRLYMHNIVYKIYSFSIYYCYNYKRYVMVQKSLV